VKKVVRCEMEVWSTELRKYIELNFGDGVAELRRNFSKVTRTSFGHVICGEDCVRKMQCVVKFGKQLGIKAGVYLRNTHFKISLLLRAGKVKFLQ